VATTETPLAREIRRRMDALGITSMRDLGRRAKLGESAVKHIFAGVSQNPRIDTLTKIASALGCAVHDLTGEEPDDEAIASQQMAGVAEIDVSASAGGGALPIAELEIAHWQFPPDFVRSDIRSRSTDLRIITIEGDSMSPTLESGDKAIIDLSRTAPSPPGVFVLWDGLALVAKRLEFIEGSEPHRVRIISDNGRYQAYERTAEEVRVVGRVRGRFQRL
jgi:phage repressor protein C with HTH and peptisase S24 domain